TCERVSISAACPGRARRQKLDGVSGRIPRRRRDLPCVDGAPLGAAVVVSYSRIGPTIPEQFDMEGRLIGRMEFFDGAEVSPKNETLAALKRDRVAARLLANFGFTHVQPRSFRMTNIV